MTKAIGGGTYMATNNGEREDVVYNAKIDTSEAVRNLKDLERKVNKLGDMADQGERMKGGFLSKKQVMLYRRILSEMETAQAENAAKLLKMEQGLTKSLEKEEIKKLRNLEENLKKRQELLRRAELNNVSPVVQEFHRVKHTEAKETLESYQKSPELKGAQEDTKRLESEIAKMTVVMEDFSAQMQRGDTHSNRIGDLRQRDPNVDRVVDAASSIANSAGLILGAYQYAQYTFQGIDQLRQQEQSAYGISQKMQGSGKSDADHRESVQAIGESNGYGLTETLFLQKQLATGGITSQDKLNEDTDSLQKYARAYGVNPDGMAEGGSLLRKMGALDEGQMDKFAKLIGGQVAKNNLGGREEEISRATVALASTVSQRMDKLSGEGLDNIVGLQGDVAEVKGLEGDRGAATLANMDGAIKNADSNFDLLLGKGTEFNSMEEMVELGYQKEKGISDPKNIQRILQNSETMFGSADGVMTESALAENNFLSQHEFRALRDKGILEKWKNGDFNTQKEVEELGIDSLTEKTKQWEGTETRDWREVEAKGENLQADHAKAAEEAATTGRDLWHGLPDPVQHTLLPMAAGAGMLGLGGLAVKGVRKLMTPRISDLPPGGGGGMGAMAGAAFEKLKGWGGSAVAATGRFASRLPAAFGDFMDDAGPLGKMAKRVPVVGSLLGVGIDRIANPENDWGRSIAKGIGGGIGGLAGILGAGALALPTGGAGLLAAGAMGTGGAMAGEKAGDWAYSLFAGDEDKTGAKEPEPVPSADDAAKSTILSGKTTDEMEIGKPGKATEEQMREATNMRFSQAPADEEISTKYRAFNNESAGSEGEKVVKIIIEGKIDGMDKDNEKDIAKSITSYFKQQSSTSVVGINSNFRYDLSLDQTRG